MRKHMWKMRVSGSKKESVKGSQGEGRSSSIWRHRSRERDIIRSSARVKACIIERVGRSTERGSVRSSERFRSCM